MAKLWVPDRREIIWINCSPHTGKEMRDIHPLLVLSPKNFNARTSIVIGLPMTSAESNDDNPFAIKFQGARSKASYVLCHQPKSFDWRQRGAKLHPWKKISDEIFDAACETLNQIVMISG
ncbi:MAG: type II toxin-antitoxin system PemK/MazF family toxin [Ottowia sp.]|nr:type II toxin-antitoxin system PemK/MazF family toxin [Ottowia sp.]